MKRSVLFRCRILGTVAFAFLAATSSHCQAQPLILQSAELGATGRVGGTTITSNQFVGWRFETSTPVAVEQVGGHMLVIPDLPGEIFAALVKLSAVDAFPEGAPFSTAEIIATTTFRPNFPSDEFLTPLEAVLIPGSYALVFGSGMDGTTGGAALHSGSDQPDIPPTNISSYIFWGVASPGEPPVWRTNLNANMRFVVTGQVASFSADFQGDGDVDSEDLNIWRTAYGTNTLGDADGDTDSDGADFLSWQRQYTGPAGARATSIPTSTSVPEPTSFALLVLCLIGVLLKRCAGGSDLIGPQTSATQAVNVWHSTFSLAAASSSLSKGIMSTFEPIQHANCRRWV